ncbi:hypothetical protein NLI96_g5380 [Meripilus lineatus]|uniref:Galectin n=1 Tax=Meripilus lineatus TaxID=2056292 RepID=A0AAD5V3L2_9APHY|nr:hypothetical protein NLI96_g5380 [Physisporinus lineatus]
MTTLTIPIGDTRSLLFPLRDGDVVSFIASTTLLQPDSSPNGDNTSLNLVSGDDDYLLHISFRRADQSVRLNSRRPDGPWGAEESFKFDGSFTDGRPSVVSVSVRGSKYLIAIDGRLRYTYAQRINAPAKGLRYGRNGDMTTAIFGNSVNAQVVHTLPPPNPSQSFSINVGDTYTLNSALTNDQFVYFISTTTSLTPDPSPGGDTTSLNLLSGDGDWLLCISIRRVNNTVVFNARNATGGWGVDEIISSKGFFQEGQPASVIVQNRSSVFDIYIDGILRYTFKKRINQPVRAVRYHRNGNMNTQVFAYNINVAIDGQ